MKTIKFKINGEVEIRNVDEQKTLLRFIREDLNLTGTKEGCAEGECGACTVILDGKAVHSCLTLAVEIDGHELETVEVLAKDGNLDILQKKFVEHNAIQCGFCTPGMLMSARALLLANPNPTTDEIKTAIEGNICRCTGYKPIINAIEATVSEGKYE